MSRQQLVADGRPDDDVLSAIVWLRRNTYVSPEHSVVS